jgi:hypothetical protein
MDGQPFRDHLKIQLILLVSECAPIKKHQMCNHGHGEGLFILGCAQVSKVYSPRV